MYWAELDFALVRGMRGKCGTENRDCWSCDREMLLSVRTAGLTPLAPLRLASAPLNIVVPCPRQYSPAAATSIPISRLTGSRSRHAEMRRHDSRTRLIRSRSDGSLFFRASFR